MPTPYDVVITYNGVNNFTTGWSVTNETATGFVIRNNTDWSLQTVNFIATERGEFVTYSTSGTSGTSGIAGLENGSGTDSLQSASYLTTTPANASAACAIAIGEGAVACSGDAVGIGRSTQAQGSGSVAIGGGPVAVNSAIAIGNSAFAGSDSTISIGPSSFASGDRGIAIGSSSKTFGQDQINIGDGSNISDCASIDPPYISIGKNTLDQCNAWNTNTRGSINIGYENIHRCAGIGIIIGNKNCQNDPSAFSNAPYNHSIIIGWDNFSRSTYTNVFGTENDVYCGGGVYGSTNTLQAPGGSIHGDNNNINGGQYPRAYGVSNCSSSGYVAMLYGDANTVSSCYGMAYGANNTVTHDCAVTLGHGITSIAACYAHLPNLYLKSPVVAADQASAVSAGLTAGQVYRTTGGDLKIVY